MIPDLIKYILQFAVYDMYAFEDALSHGLANESFDMEKTVHIHCFIFICYRTVYCSYIFY